MNKKNWKLYVHISPNNKRYYGITKIEVKKRWKNGRGYDKQPYFYRAINKYGWDNFQHEVLFNDLSKEEAELLEQIYICLYDTTNPSKGYNQTFGGESGNYHTEETKQKLSKTMQGENNPMYGKHHTEETREKQSKLREGKYIGEDNPNAKKIRCVEINTIFNTVNEASEFINRKPSAISYALKHRSKSGGYHWEYVN